MTVIAISGQPGAGSTTASKILAHELALNHFSPGRVFKDLSLGVVKQQFYYTKLQQKCTERNIVLPDYSAANDTLAVLNLWDTEFGKSKTFHEILDQLQKDLAHEGKIVIDGKLSLRMLDSANVKVWLKASPHIRAQRTARRDTGDVHKLQEMLLQREQVERTEWKKIYGFDYWDQENMADLVIDTSNKDPAQVASEIVAYLSNSSSN